MSKEEGVIYTVEKDQKILDAFKEAMVCDELISQQRDQKKAIMEALSEEVEIDKQSLAAAYRMFMKSLEGNEKPIEKNETALNVTNRLNNLMG